MRIDLRNHRHERLFRVEVDARHPPIKVKPPSGEGPEVYLEWEQALDDEGRLRRCPACGCRELFVRQDFPQVTGFVIVLLAVVVALVLFRFRQVLAALISLGGLVLVDLVIFFFTGKCLVCYRCRSEFRKLPISRDHPGWDLAIGEKYRQAEAQENTED